MKSFLKVFAFSAILSLMPLAGAYGNEHDGGHGGEAEGEKKAKGNISAEDLDQMRQSQLLESLDSESYQASEYSMYYFEQKGEASVMPLLNYLKRNDDNEKKVSAVIYTIGRLGKNGSRAVPALMHFLNHSNFDIRTTTIAALGKIGHASNQAVPEIARYLENDNEWVRSIALRSLKDIKTPHALAIATQYENQLKLEQERNNIKLMSGDKNTSVAEADKKAEAEKVGPEKGEGE